MTEEYREINKKRLEMLEAANRVALWVYWSDELGTWDQLRTSVAPDLAEFRKAQAAWFDDHKTPAAEDRKEIPRALTDAEAIQQCRDMGFNIVATAFSDPAYCRKFLQERNERTD